MAMDQKQERNMAMFCHLGALAGFLIPFGNIIAPLVIWLTKKNDSALIDKEGKKSLNFQISVAIYMVISAILIFIVIGFALMAAVAVFSLVMIIIASIKVNSGEDFKYPLSFEFIK